VLTALYDAYFLRAPDRAGFDYWIAQSGSDSNALPHLSEQFLAHPYAQATLGYGAMTDRAFVAAIYRNVLSGTGSTTPGDDEITYWTNWLAQSGHSRAGMVLKFISDALTFDANTLADPAAKEAAQHRQDTLWNKIQVARTFIDTLGSRTNIADPSALTADPAFQASQRILQGITYDSATRDCTKAFIAGIARNADPIGAINTASNQALFCRVG